MVESVGKALRAEYGHKEPDLSISVHPAAAAPTVLDAKHAQGVVDLLRTLPHGPLKYSHVVPGLVETSNNVASIKPG